MNIRQSHRRTRDRRTRDRRRVLSAESLEDRRLLAVLTVTDLRDGTLANLSGDGQLSLREAIEAANTDSSVDGSIAGSGADEIRFASGLTGTISLSGSRLEVTDELTLTGPAVAPGAELLEISGQDTVQVLHVGNTRLTIDRLSLDSGRGTAGGNIQNEGDLLIRGSTLFSGWATVDGGGIHNTGTVTIVNSTFWGNGTNRHGGAIYNAGTLALINSTIARSRAHFSGGGIHNAAGTVIVINSTIAESRADANDTGSGDGGGVWTKDDPAAKTFLYNTIVAGNDAGFITFQHKSDVAGKDVEPGSANNLISDPMSAGGLAEGVAGNLIGDGSGNLLGLFFVVDIPPTPNGGNTPTYRPQPGSRAIDAGSNQFATTLGDDGMPGTGDTNETTLLTDQRGAPFLRTFGPAVDIGAVETQTVPAELLVVTTTADQVNYADADVSLREAINSALGSVGDDTITFGGPIFFDETPDTIALEQGQLWIFDTDALTIRGPGSDRLSINAQNQSRVIYFEAFDGELHLESITITGGRASYYGAGIQFRDGSAFTITDSVISGNTVSGEFGEGGGIYSTSNVAVTRSRITGNSAPGSGGGLYSREFDYDTTITESVITGNTAGGGGGGIYAGLLAITDSTITGNTASGRGGGTLGFYAKVTRSTFSGNRAGSDGGGVAAYSSTEVSDSTITSNTADGRGGGIYAGENLIVRQSTIDRNTANGDGGGIVSPWSGDITLVNSTVSGNRSSNGRGGGLFFDDGAARIINSTVFGNIAGGVGGGIGNLNDGFGESLTIHNSIVATNSDDGTAPEFVPPHNAVANLDVRSSLIGVNTGTTLDESRTADPDTGNLVGSSASAIDPKLGFIDLNGGVTATHVLMPGSPAIDAGNALLAVGPGPDGVPGNGDDAPLSSDQRGDPFARVSGAGIDIGAYESEGFDFGDAPDPYPTRLPDGASHAALELGPRLGPSRDREPDGQPTADASGDGSDDDGALFGTIYSASPIAAVNVLFDHFLSARVDAWIDFDRDGVWEPSEKILDSIEVFNAIQTLNYNLPTGLVAGDTFARIRLSTLGGLAPTGPAADGEVEDYVVTIDPPPKIESVVINRGDAQRSSIDRLTVSFDRIVAIDQTSGDPFRIVNTENNEPVIDVPVISEVNGKTVVELSFQPGASVTDFGSLVDGNYRLTVDASLITRFGIAVDGDGDGAAGGNHLFGGQAADRFYRKYGDANGNGSVELFDFAAFRSAFGSSVDDANHIAALDSNGDTVINLFDFAAFRANFGT